MQVIFNVAPRFVSATEKALEVYNADYNERVGYGNSVPFNRNQKFVFNGECLTYTGERHPLWQDGGWLVIADSQGLTRGVNESNMAFVARVEKINPVEYCTSVAEMHWHEVIEQTIVRLGEKFVNANAKLFMLIISEGNSELYRALREHAPLFFQKTVFQLKKMGWDTDEDWVINSVHPKNIDLILDPEYKKLSGYRKVRYQEWFLKV